MVPSAGLPNFAEPDLIGFGAVLGAALARTVAWLLGYDDDKGIRWAVNGGYCGTVVALAVYLIVNLLEVGLS